MKRVLNFIGLFLLPFLLGAQEGSPQGWASLNGGTTGGEGGEVVIITNRAELLANVTGSTPRILLIRDTVELRRYERVKVYANKTILGETPRAMIRFGGLEILGNNVIVQNLAIGDFYDGDPSGTTNSTDCLTIYAQNVWIDHCFLWSGADGLLDIRSGNGNVGDYITVSYTKFSNHNKVTLVGSSDNDTGDRDHLRVTFHHCWYEGTTGRQLTQRMPRVRFGDVHVLNNYYEEVQSYCVAARFESDIVVESTYFRNSKNPHLIDDQGEGLEDPDLVSINNIYEATSGSRSVNGVAFNPGDFYAYDVTPTQEVPALVMNEAGPFNYADNDVPEAVTDTVDYSVPTGAVVVDVTANDTDKNGGDLRIARVLNNPPGIEVIKNNQLTYIPPAGAAGVDTLLYVLVDTQGGVDTGRVLIYYDGVPSSVRVYGDSEWLRAFPNPANDFTEIELHASLRGATLRVFSANGQLVATDDRLQLTSASAYRLQTGDLPPGLYVLSVEADGHQYTRRFQVAR